MNYPAASCEVSQLGSRLMVRIRLVDLGESVGRFFPVPGHISWFAPRCHEGPQCWCSILLSRIGRPRGISWLQGFGGRFLWRWYSWWLGQSLPAASSALTESESGHGLHRLRFQRSGCRRPERIPHKLPWASVLPVWWIFFCDTLPGRPDGTAYSLHCVVSLCVPPCFQYITAWARGTPRSKLRGNLFDYTQTKRDSF